MKLTKQLRSEIQDVYDAFMGSLFNIDIEIYSLLLDDNYRLIGTTDKEVFFNKKDAIRFLKETADQLGGNIERRKSKIKIEVIDNLVLITEQFHAYVLIENDWTFYGKVRVSTWMQQQPRGWKLVQQHFSLPDTKAEEGQTIGLEKISKENIELKEAIKRRTIELEHKNRELEIETALEKVRARTMAMHRSEELSETAAVLFQEFKKLGEEDLLQITFGIYHEAEGIMEFHVTSWAGGGAQVNRTFNLSIEEPNVLKPAFTARKKKKKTHVVDLTGKKLEGWLKYRNANVGVTVRSEDTHGRRVVSIAFFSKGHVSISSPEPKSPETIQLLERFAGVFDLTYTRFLDLKNAEAQTRESQIELGMERVRARAMAMTNSMSETTNMWLLRNQLRPELCRSSD